MSVALSMSSDFDQHFDQRPELEVVRQPQAPDAPPKRHRVTVTEFGRMVDAGVFDPEARLELINGEILERPRVSNPPHAFAVAMLAKQLNKALDDRASVRPEGDAVLDDYSQPIPDVSVAPLPEVQWARRHPEGPELLLAVEVSDSTIRLDRKIKAPLYARTGVRETWIVDVNRRVIDVLTEPDDDGYTRTERFGPGQAVSPEAFPDVTIAVDDLLPEPEAESEPGDPAAGSD